MSKHINVNPDHYKVAGRDRPGNIVAKAPKAQGSGRVERDRWQRRQKNKKGLDK